MRASLVPRRLGEIERGLLRGEHFICHATTREGGWSDDGDTYSITGPELVCAGAIDWQARRRLKADLVQVMERLEAFARRKK